MAVLDRDESGRVVKFRGPSGAMLKYFFFIIFFIIKAYSDLSVAFARLYITCYMSQ